MKLDPDTTPDTGRAERDTTRWSAFTILISAVLGLGLGALSGRILFDGTAWNLLPWALGSIAIGIVANRAATALISSGVYSYLLTALFLTVANTGNDPLTQRIPFTLLFALIGPLCSLPLTTISRLTSLRVHRKAKEHNSHQ